MVIVIEPEISINSNFCMEDHRLYLAAGVDIL